jgi:dolichyl-phosphate-mannose--protein O-mannosyl transferase
MFFIQSRIAMLDIFVAFLIVLAYWLFLLHLDSNSPRQSTWTLLLTGTALGLGIATKWSVLAAWGVILFLLAVWIARKRLPFHLSWRREAEPPAAERSLAIPGGDAPWLYAMTVVFAFLAIPLVIYLASWFPFFIRGQFHTLGDIINHDYQAFQFNATLTATHPYGSKWYTWPLLYRPVLYYFEGNLGTDAWTQMPLEAAINDLGNPWIWWTSLPCLVAMVYFVWRRHSFAALLIGLAFAAQYLPWSRVSRVLFLYEMAAALPFMVLALAFVLTRIAERNFAMNLAGARFTLLGREVAYMHLFVALLFFLYFYPLWTGLPLSNQALLGHFPHGKIWFPKWI